MMILVRHELNYNEIVSVCAYVLNVMLKNDYVL